jgi:gamma-glutamylcyclotransferase (GGCT)/AIG2-like uncharacterized protein YtfP
MLSTKTSSIPESEQYIFVYGSLRPDVKAPWTDVVYSNKKFKVDWTKGVLRNAKLYFDTYAITEHDEKKYTSNQCVIGFVITSPDNLEGLVRECDRIEGYPSYYGKKKVSIELDDGRRQEAVMYTKSIENAKPVEKDVCDYLEWV